MFISPCGEHWHNHTLTQAKPQEKQEVKALTLRPFLPPSLPKQPPLLYISPQAHFKLTQELVGEKATVCLDMFADI